MRISNHFIERFNQRYMKNNFDWKIPELRNYMKRVLRCRQIRLIEKNKYSQKPHKIGFGKHHTLIIRNNTFITLLDKRN